MYEEYKTSITSSQIEVAPNSFLVILPKLNLKNEYVLMIKKFDKDKIKKDVINVLNKLLNTLCSNLTEM